MSDTKIEIRQALLSDRDKILDFLKCHWSEKHVFVRVPELFDYQHAEGDKIQYLLALDAQCIVGVLGYITYGETYDESDAFIALWKVREDYQGRIGIDLMNEFAQMGFRSCSCIGIAEKVLPIYKFMGYKTGKMHHHFILNDEIELYKLCEVNTSAPRIKSCSEEYSLRHVNDTDTLKRALNLTNNHFYKSFTFFKKRYMEHPYYEYKLLGIFNKDRICTVMVCREQEVDDVKVLRVVDVIGQRDLIYNTVSLLKRYVIEVGYEYADMYQYGLDEMKLHKSGFILKDPSTDIVPNYFEPFDKKNVDLNWATKLRENYVFFKADGDQDRPNLLGR